MTTQLAFKKATRVQPKLRLAIAAPPGGGKTWTALTLAKYLGGRTALIDTEHGSASKYADVFDFDALELDNFALDTYIAAIQTADAAGYDNLIIDGLSHAWVGTGGALEEVDNLKRAAKSGNAFTEGWGKVTPKQNKLVDTILASRMHVIATMRQKMSYELETVNGRSNTPVKKGLAPIQREGMEYEFDIIGEMDPVDNSMRISKTRCPALTGKTFDKPGRDLAAILKAWLSDGAPRVEPAAAMDDTPPAKPAPARAALPPRPSPQAAVTPPVEDAVDIDEAEGYLLGDDAPAAAYPDVELPADIPTVGPRFFETVNAHRAQLGRAPYDALYGLQRVLSDAMPDGFNWNMLRDDGARVLAYRAAMAHVRRSEKVTA